MANRSESGEQAFPLHEEFITLGQLLKAVGILGTGGEVRFYLAEKEVRVNGDPEQRRGRKLRVGDVVSITGASPIHIVEAGEQ